VSSDLADEVQLHDMAMNGGMMQMQEMVDGVNVNIGETLEFRPGGKHIMLLGLKKPLNDGDSFELTLRFKNRDELTLLVNVKDARNLN
jgi:copper(I)-binding protein